MSCELPRGAPNWQKGSYEVQNPFDTLRNNNLQKFKATGTTNRKTTQTEIPSIDD